MARKIVPLTLAQVRNAKPKERLYKISDGGGLALWVYPNGRRTWRFEFRRKIDQKLDTLTLGSVDDFALSDARIWREENRARLARGENIKTAKAHVVTFKSMFDLWYARWSKTVTEKYALQVSRGINANVMAYLSNMEINAIKPINIVEALTPIEARGKLEYLRRIKQSIKLVFDFAVARGIAEYNPVIMVNNTAFKAHKRGHFAALKPEQLPDLILWLEAEKIEVITRLCIYFQLLTMARPGEACGAKWSEVDFEQKLWVLPPERMKNRRGHIVPLSSLAIEVLRKAHKISGGREFVFLGRDFNNHINVETARQALRRSGLDTTAHGLRSLASTILNESGLFRYDVIESALAHAQENKVRAAYNRAEYIQERTEMLEWLSNLISGTKK